METGFYKQITHHAFLPLGHYLPKPQAYLSPAGLMVPIPGWNVVLFDFGSLSHILYSLLGTSSTFFISSHLAFLIAMKVHL